MHPFQEAIDFTLAHETSWSRENLDNFGIHKADPAPWNQLLGPVHPRGGVSGVIHVAGEKVVARIKHIPDPTIIKIVEGWPMNFDTKRARSLGFTSEATFEEIIRVHIEDELQGKIA